MKVNLKKERAVARKLAAMIHDSMLERYPIEEVNRRLDAIHRIAEGIKVNGTSSKRGRTRVNRRRTRPPSASANKRARPWRV
ncbi:MAG: hypothetical protein L0Z53_12050 [Acidobacteriales bacterium]|nr:hypothetical protein [Terriglobales bacterium]